MRDLAPDILRPRLIVEGVPTDPISQKHIIQYLHGLSGVLGMQPLIPPVTHLSPKFGWAGWIHWQTSGAHFFAFDFIIVLFSFEIYTCKAFDHQLAVEFTQAALAARPIVHRSV